MIRPLRERIAEHFRALKNDTKYPIVLHTLEGVPGTHMHRFSFHGIDHVRNNIHGGNRELQLRSREAIWIMKLRAVEHGINIDTELQYFLGD